MAEESSQPIRLMNFVSEEQLDEAKKTRGARVEDGTLHRDRTLYEILKENKDKKDAEFNERFKHWPPKALDEDETEFLDKLELSRREFEQQVAHKEAEQLRSFQAAVAAQSTIVQELKETPAPPAVQSQTSVVKKHPATRPLSMIIKVKPQRKKAKMDQESVKEPSDKAKELHINNEKSSNSMKTPNGDAKKCIDDVTTGLVSYSDESEDDD